MKRFLGEFFYLQRSDRKVILTLLAVAVVALGVVFLAGEDSDGSVPTDADSLTSLLSSDTVAARHYRRPHGSAGYYRADGPQRRLFAFDPNTADSTQLLHLGLASWQVRNILRYRAHGGVYRRKEDFARVYGLTRGDYKRLEPYIRISDDYLPAATLSNVREAAADDKPFGLDTIVYPEKIAPGEKVDLNSADSAMLRSVPGIGVHFAHEILRYRNRLGGYAHVDQLDEIDYFPAAAKAFFVVGSQPVRRLNVNRLTLSQLRRHPYISFRQAKAIVDYRRLHGAISSLKQLQLSPDFTPEAISRLEPYVEY
jgi:DNA uptake protein ComE-like DNA-binding protein